MPTDRCGCYRKFILPVDGARCNKCNCMVHRSCVALPAKGTLSPTWRCPECRKGDVRDNRDDTPVRGRPFIKYSYISMLRNKIYIIIEGSSACPSLTCLKALIDIE
ncbi:hypothetical protein K1T71_008485 [Dendrolimus kikuchii]|uniref:Uncharacterized protein n=1 Tax=Dendrolimus kikuchii TaxID=765133 RepID=A0ACC1CX88_9NEOP|nr:hypothetical protein K1T71_008485 [Dendrolimus kikuchii]